MWWQWINDDDPDALNMPAVVGLWCRCTDASATRDPNSSSKDWAESFGMACGEPSRTDVFDIDDAEAFAAAGFNLDAQVTSTLIVTAPPSDELVVLVLRVCRTLQPGLFLGRMEVDWLCGFAATSGRGRKWINNVNSAASAARD